MCTTNEWCEFNKNRSRKSLRDKVSNLILTDRFWKKAGEVQTIMEPLVKVLKLVDQDKSPLWTPYFIIDNLDWLDKGLFSNEEGTKIIHEDDGATNRRVGRRTSNATQERYIDFRHKGKAPRTIYSSSIVMMVTMRGNRRVGGTSEGIGGDGSTKDAYVNQVDLGMSWAQGDENYYATQDTDHGY
ncbi:hypothetical protein AAG906_000520 [Vitis piasezkii]